MKILDMSIQSAITLKQRGQYPMNKSRSQKNHKLFVDFEVISNNSSIFMICFHTFDPSLGNKIF